MGGVPVIEECMDGEEGEALRVSPARLLAAAGTLIMCGAIVYNALAGQDGRHRNAFAELAPLEQELGGPDTSSLKPAAIRRAATRVHVDAGANPGEAGEPADVATVKQIQEDLAALHIYSGAVDGKVSPRLKEAIAAYQRGAEFEPTGAPTRTLADNLRLARQFADASQPVEPRRPPPASDEASPIGRPAPQASGSPNIQAIQQQLARLGYSPGPADGTLGPKTREAILLFARDRKLRAAGELTPSLLQAVERVASGG
jgi:peptidoglycan hydrolase-like protein with peptidoglycan-binding domain